MGASVVEPDGDVWVVVAMAGVSWVSSPMTCQVSGRPSSSAFTRLTELVRTRQPGGQPSSALRTTPMIWHDCKLRSGYRNHSCAGSGVLGKCSFHTSSGQNTIEEIGSLVGWLAAMVKLAKQGASMTNPTKPPPHNSPNPPHPPTLQDG